MAKFQPGAIVLQCGADSLQHDRLGCFNLSVEGHSDAVAFMKTFHVPMLVTGGGGYTKANVARCWTKETAVLTDTDIPDQLPVNAYYEYFGPSHSLHTLNAANYREFIENANTSAYVESVKREVMAACLVACWINDKSALD